jgi:ABC-2 type transport system ATP-binding protein
MKAHSLLRLDTAEALDTMRALEGQEGILDVAVFGSGLHVVVDDEEASMPRIRAALAAKGIEIRRLEPIDPSLEDVFVALIEAEERKVA